MLSRVSKKDRISMKTQKSSFQDAKIVEAGSDR